MEAFKRIKLGQALTFQRGFDITKAQQTHGSIPIVSSSGVSSHHNTSKADPPGIVIGRKGTLGTVHFLNTHYWPHDTTLWVKDFKGNDPRFLYYFLKTLRLENFDTGSSNPTLNRNHLHKIEVVFPRDVETQRKIAGILSAYDDLIENNRRRIAILERMAEELYREWFVRMRFPGYQNTKFVKGVPEGWEVKSLGSIYDTTSGGTPSRTELGYYTGEIPWVKTGELNNRFIHSTEESITEVALESSSAKLFPAGTVIIALYGATIGELGILGCAAATNQACAALFPKDPRYHYSYTIHLMRSIKSGLVAIAFGGAQQNISQTLIRQFKVFVPSAQLIEQYVQNTKPMYGALEKLQLASVVVKNKRNALLNRLISGSINVEGLTVKFPKGSERITSHVEEEELSHA